MFFFQDRKINEEVDLLLRQLDEFEQLLVLSQSDANVCLFKHVPGLQTKFGEMQSVFEKIDRLEFMIARVKNDMDKIERQLSEAESTVDENSALKSFVPFIFVSLRMGCVSKSDAIKKGNCNCRQNGKNLDKV